MLAKAIESELHALISRMSLRSWVGYFLAMAVFGVLAPLHRGLDFLDVPMLLAYAVLPCLLVASLVAEAVVGRVPVPPRAGYAAQVLAPFLFACCWGLVIFISAFITLSVSRAVGRIIFPPWPIMAHVVLFTLAAVMFAACLTGWIALNAKTASQAKALARRVVLGLLLLVLMWARLGPLHWKHELENYLTSDRLWVLLVPVSAVLAVTGLGLLSLGARRREEEANGPLLRLQ